MTGVDYILEPNHDKHQEYMFYYKKYREFYELAKDWMHDVTEYSKRS